MASDPVKPTVPHRSVFMQYTGERRDMMEGMRAAGMTGVNNILELWREGKREEMLISSFF